MAPPADRDDPVSTSAHRSEHEHRRLDHGHAEEAEEFSNEHPGLAEHEHPDSFFPEPIVDPHRFFVLRTAIAMATQGERARAEAYERVAAALETKFQELDQIVDIGRWMLYGDAEAAAFFRHWLLALPSEELEETLVRTASGEESARAETRDLRRTNDWDHFGDGSVDIPNLSPVPDVLNWEPILDLFIEAAYSAGVNEELRQAQVTAVSDLVLELASVIDPLHHFAKDYLEGRSRPGILLQLLETLIRGHAIPQFPREHDECRMALQDVMMRQGSALSRTMEAIEIDANTDRIIQIIPDQICAPGQVRIRASESARFDVAQPQGVGVYVDGTDGTIDSWGDLEVLATFPEKTSSGYVHFHKVPVATAVIGESIAKDMEALGACPMVAGGMVGRGSALASAYLGLPNKIQPIRVPDHRRSETFVTVRHMPAIVQFTARDEKGRQISGFNAAEACSKVTLHWAVLSDDPTPPQVDILEGGSVRFANLAASGTHVFYPDSYLQLTLRAQNGCGVTTADFDLQMASPVLRVQQNQLKVLHGLQATISFSFSCPVKSDTIVTFTSSDTAKVTVTPSVTIAAGSSQGQATVTGVAPGKAEQVTATVTVSAPTFASQNVAIWVENPQGEWATVKNPADPTQDLDLGMIAIHAALLRTGKVLFFAGDEDDKNALDKVKMVLWNPSSGALTDIAATMPAPRNLFCAGHSFLSDGRLLVAAGHAHSPIKDLSEEVIGAIIGGIVTGGLGGAISGGLVGMAVGRGVDHDIHVYNPFLNEWTRHRDMDKARWYPSCVTLSNGKVLIVSGYCAGAPPHPFTLFGAPVNEDYDLFDPTTGDLETIKNPHFLSNIDLYPRLHVLPGGVLFVHSRNQTFLFYPDANAPGPLKMTKSPRDYFTISPNRRTYPLQGACVLLPLIPESPNDVRVMVIGGGFEMNTTISWTNPATDSAEIFDFDTTLGPGEAHKGWRDTRCDGTPLRTFRRRFMSDAILLPDRTVLVVGGAGVGRDDFNSDPVFEAASFESETEVWRHMASSTVERRYHSTALLLPDGRVVSAGSSGGWPGPPWESPHPDSPQYRLEVFTPPYLFRGPRPKITWLGNTRWSYGQAVSIDTDQPAEIGSAALIRASSATHTTNMDQRYVGLEITFRGTDWISVRTPADATLAPPGVYMLFLVRGSMLTERIPSTAKFVELG